ELQAFIDSVRAGQVGGPSAWDGFAAAVAADACIEAQGSEQIVKVSLPERPHFYG
ncbi:MAG TPA: inositol 2-dehydrogenase, partial [Pseudomonas sp.]|nr:inositol 2-dehydrogenase [Pseudomonas sp.]